MRHSISSVGLSIVALFDFGMAARAGVRYWCASKLILCMTAQELIELASKVAGTFKPSEDCNAGGVGAALVTVAGNLYTGVSVDTACSLGFCAEHSAIAEMLKGRESAIRLIVAVDAAGVILTPCGRCRELIRQVSPRNTATEVIVGPDRVVPLSELLPDFDLT
jgi:cytidine deaminase